MSSLWQSSLVVSFGCLILEGLQDLMSDLVKQMLMVCFHIAYQLSLEVVGHSLLSLDFQVQPSHQPFKTMELLLQQWVPDV